MSHRGYTDPVPNRGPSSLRHDPYVIDWLTELCLIVIPALLVLAWVLWR